MGKCLHNLHGENIFLDSEVQDLGKMKADPRDRNMLSGYLGKYVHNKCKFKT